MDLRNRGFEGGRFEGRVFEYSRFQGRGSACLIRGYKYFPA